MTNVSKLVTDQINSNRVVVYSKTGCPYCIRSKEELKKLVDDMLVVETDHVENGASIRSYLREQTGQSTVPNIFINKKHVGGCDDLLEKIRNGQINSLLAA
ncbi:Glutaredoxin-C3 [Smittium mucronatum]|uniref:Glutaredoxin-C3 n=1 Tax=Smittium mucronatum TaxID=133383 RepID=A0A1R0H0Q9_9FUNG|nr:Glutaredoxin-C3 [Smittium mucronatum]